MSTDQILFGVGLILVLAVGSQVLASRLRIPALILLLPAGFIAGALTTDASPERLLGPAFQPLVSLAVAVILYDSGLALEWGKVHGRARRVVPRLVIWGVPITMAFAAVSAGPLLGMSAGAALMTGAILVVSGPTVVGPLLAFVRPSDRLQRILSWEGSLIDPVGGILGAVVFCAVLASTSGGVAHPVGQFLLPPASAWPARRSASRCCGSACANFIWTMYSARRANWRAWLAWPPPAISSVTTPGSLPRS